MKITGIETVGIRIDGERLTFTELLIRFEYDGMKYIARHIKNTDPWWRDGHDLTIIETFMDDDVREVESSWIAGENAGLIDWHIEKAIESIEAQAHTLWCRTRIIEGAAMSGLRDELIDHLTGAY